VVETGGLENQWPVMVRQTSQHFRPLPVPPIYTHLGSVGGDLGNKPGNKNNLGQQPKADYCIAT
jgi:hypothetical protein